MGAIGKEYTVIKQLGQGSFSTVFLVQCIADQQEYVLKLINRRQRMESRINLEIQILQDIRGIRGVSHYVRHFNIGYYVAIVTTYDRGQELFDYLLQHGPMSEQDAKHVFRQLCLVMHAVHQQGIAHRDIKPENIIITDNLDIIIVDWGLAFYPARTIERGSCGSPNYAAPEIIAAEPRIYNGPDVDLWSLGCVLYAMLTVHNAFDADVEGLDLIPALRKILLEIENINVNYTLQGLTPQSVALLKRIFVHNSKRATMPEILADQWLANE